MRRCGRPHTDAVVGITRTIVNIADEYRETNDLTGSQIMRNHLIFSDIFLSGLRIGIDSDGAEFVDIGALSVFLAFKAIGAVIPAATISQERRILLHHQN